MICRVSYIPGGDCRNSEPSTVGSGSYDKTQGLMDHVSLPPPHTKANLRQYVSFREDNVILVETLMTQGFLPLTTRMSRPGSAGTNG